MAVIVLAEDQVHKMSAAVHNGQAVQLMIPDHIIGFSQRNALFGVDQGGQRSHEFGNRAFLR
ncbi:hypothetical protein D3C85_1665720 [compost metagenome]